MNERIQELMNQTGVPVSMPFDKWCEKFAELIVRECMTVCENLDKEYDGEDVLATWCATEIGKHFGIKESKREQIDKAMREAFKNGVDLSGRNTP